MVTATVEAVVAVAVVAGAVVNVAVVGVEEATIFSSL